jgi:hypothetical protein
VVWAHVFNCSDRQVPTIRQDGNCICGAADVVLFKLGLDSGSGFPVGSLDQRQ